MTHQDYALTLYAKAPQDSMPEWQLVLYFYAAVHAINHAMYDGINVDWSHDHTRRELEIAGNKVLRPLLFKYRALRRESEVARYKPWLHPITANRISYAATVTKEILIACGITLAGPLSSS